TAARGTRKFSVNNSLLAKVRAMKPRPNASEARSVLCVSASTTSRANKPMLTSAPPTRPVASRLGTVRPRRCMPSSTVRPNVSASWSVPGAVSLTVTPSTYPGRGLVSPCRRASVGRGRDQLDLEAVAVLEVGDLGAARDGVAVARHGRPAEAAGAAGDGCQRVGGVDRERHVVEAGAKAAVQHAGHHV